MKTAFITGATGFVGLNLTKLLLEKGWKVIALHRKTSNLKYLGQTNAQLCVGTITDKASLSAAMPQRADAVFHVAANTSMWSKMNDRQYEDNVTGTKNMVEIALEKNVGRFIHTSSVSAFGHHDDRIDETVISNALHSPVNYNKTKFLAEQEVEKALQNGLDAVILNPCDIMGPYDSHNWSQMILAVYNDDVPGIPPGNGSFCHVRDIAEAHLAAYQKGRTGERYLLSGVDATFQEVFNLIEKMMDKKESTMVMPMFVMRLAMIGYWLQSKFNGREPILTPEKITELTVPKSADSSKAQQELGYRISPLETSIRDSYEWLKQEDLLKR